MTLVTIPPRGSDTAVNEDDYCELLTTEATKTRILNAPGFPKPVPRLYAGQSPLYEVNMTPEWRLDIFATRKIKAGEIVLTERPIFGGPKVVSILQSQDPSFVLQTYEKIMEASICRMSDANQNIYKGLAKGATDGRGLLTGIRHNNCYAVDEIFDGHESTPLDHYSFVGNVASRINHSCLGNVTLAFDPLSFSLVFKAVVDIKAGEQLFYSYCEVEASIATRRRNLAHYGFICQCRVCQNANLESDEFREQYQTRIAELCTISANVISGANTSWLTNKEFEDLLQLNKVAIEEGLDALPSYRELLGALTLGYWKQGNGLKARDCFVKMQVIESIFNAS
ncbi:SET domain-containing protein [Pholiota conissans]|uniref:SET domain-containing protein n=1 Tax=Pholiota conissans TaxID=109636 RepID=A0A9P6CWA0_9AGAR|nr:SET domain-containing protein [Pholiota conissans]